MRSGTVGRVLTFAAVFATGVGAPVAKAQPAKWDQKHVASLAEQLAAAVSDLRQTVFRQPPGNRPPQRKVRFQALDDLATLRQITGSFARALKAGRGREETYPTFRRIQLMQRDLEGHARRADMKIDTIKSAERAADLIRQIQPFYEEEEKEVEGAEGAQPAAPPAPAPPPTTPAPAQ